MHLLSSPNVGGTATAATSVPTPKSNTADQTDSSCGTPTAPSSYPGGKLSTGDDKKSRRTSLQVHLPKLPSSDSLTNSPGPSSPGISAWKNNSPKQERFRNEKAFEASKLNRKESYKAQRQNYRREKKRVTAEMLSYIQDPGLVINKENLKVRGTLKSWTRLVCVLKPGAVILYKSFDESDWVGTVLLNSCQVIERPSKKDGYCFKLFNPLEQSIWAPRGPNNETVGAVVQPLPTTYLIFRAPNWGVGKHWMEMLDLCLLQCSLLRSSTNGPNAVTPVPGGAQIMSNECQTQWSENDEHFKVHEMDDDTQPDMMYYGESEVESDSGPDWEDLTETQYVVCHEDEFGAAGEQVEELAEEHKSLIWFLVKQVRPGMDLSKVVLPTFILEPRSFLDKLSDSYYHADILSRAASEDDPFTRIKAVVQWYMSGFYKKPKGLKKPYNPILGETFRCYWEHPNGSRTYYIAEQVSHHPPVSAFYVTNRQDGFSMSCSILAKSKFYGNSTSAILDGVAKLTLLPRGEQYTLTTPYAHCKGILMGTLSMELGGKVAVDCENTGYRAELEFKLKPFLGGSEYTNLVVGKIKLGKETLANIHGHWDGAIKIKDSRTNTEETLFEPTVEQKANRLKRFTVSMDEQQSTDSEKLWANVSAAILRDDQQAATVEKTALEEVQRSTAKLRKATASEWIPTYFEQDIMSGQWFYKYADLRPWDVGNDLRQFETKYQILTKTKHRAPIVRTASIVSTEPIAIADSRQSLVAAARKRAFNKSKSNFDTGEGAALNHRHSESSQSDDEEEQMNSKSIRNSKLYKELRTINCTLEEQSKKLIDLQKTIEKIGQSRLTTMTTQNYRNGDDNSSFLSLISSRKVFICWAFIIMCILLQILVSWK